MMKNFCPDCEPYHLDPRHIDDRLESALSILLTPLTPVFQVGRRALDFLPLDRWLIRGIFSTLRVTKLMITRPTAANDTRLSQRTRVILEETQRRGLTVEQFLIGGQPTNFFLLETPTRTITFEGLPTMPVDHRKQWDFDDKILFKNFLASHGFPHAPGQAFHRLAAGLTYGRQLGFPLVVKPRTGSLTRHTTTAITNEADLAAAIRSAQRIEYRYVVERHVSGSLFRVVLVRGKFVAAVHREPANITGDGQRSIAELVALKNRDPRRGDRFSKTHSLHQIRLADPVVVRHLASQDLTTSSIPAAGQKVICYPKSLMISGADLHDVTDQVHLETRDLCERLAQLFAEQVIGFDLIAEDIAQPYHQQSFAFIEANSLPQIEMHHYPATGTPRNVAKLVLDQVLGEYPGVL